jgi:hypothetical protein
MTSGGFLLFKRISLMRLIRTLAEMADACSQPLDPELLEILGGYAAALEEFGDDLQADILIVQAGDTLVQAERTCGERLVVEGRFAFLAELIMRHDHWFDVVWIRSDSGDGLVLLIEIAAETDPQLLSACESALAEVPVRDQPSAQT